MVWVAISNRGISKPLFRPSKSEAVNLEIYISECLEKRIREHHPDSNYIFWRDLAGCHYFRQTVVRMDENVKFVPKEINLPNVPPDTSDCAFLRPFDTKSSRRRLKQSSN